MCSELVHWICCWSAASTVPDKKSSQQSVKWLLFHSRWECCSDNCEIHLPAIERKQDSHWKRMQCGCELQSVRMVLLHHLSASKQLPAVSALVQQNDMVLLLQSFRYGWQADSRQWQRPAVHLRWFQRVPRWRQACFHSARLHSWSDGSWNATFPVRGSVHLPFPALAKTDSPLRTLQRCETRLLHSAWWLPTGCRFPAKPCCRRISAGLHWTAVHEWQILRCHGCPLEDWSECQIQGRNQSAVTVPDEAASECPPGQGWLIFVQPLLIHR